MSTLDVTTLEPREFAEWREFVGRSPGGSVYAEPDYLEALAAATGANFRIVGVRRAGVLVGGVGLYENRSPLLGRHALARLICRFPELRKPLLHLLVIRFEECHCIPVTSGCGFRRSP